MPEHTDTERIDWLQANSNLYAVIRIEMGGDDIRQAIDAAMEAEDAKQD